MHNTNINSYYHHFFYYYSDSRWSNSQRATIQQQQLQFGMAAPVFTPTSGGLVGSRWVSTVPLNPNPPPPPQLSYTLITVAMASSPPACLSTDPTFTAPPPRLEYRQGSHDGWKILNYCKEVTDITVTECIFSMFKPSAIIVTL